MQHVVKGALFLPRSLFLHHLTLSLRAISLPINSPFPLPHLRFSSPHLKSMAVLGSSGEVEGL